MGKIRVFVSYRREDSRHQAGRLHDDLVAHFGARQVFKDVDSIPPGLDFRAVLTERVAGCDVFVAVIGDAWLSVAGKDGTRRLDDPSDFVRIEVEAALSRKIPVIPVLVGNSSVPPPRELPESLRELAFRHAVPVRPDPDFHRDTERLIRGIKEAVSALRAGPAPAPRQHGRRPRWPLLVAAAVLGVVLLGVIVYVTTDKGRITMVVNDPKAVVKIDGEAVRIEALGAPITLRAGVHDLEVKWGDGEFQTRRFVVRRGENEALRVEYEPARTSAANARPQQPAAVTPGEAPPPLARAEPVPAPAARPAPAPADAPKVITNTIGMKLVLIPAGEFLMGSPDTDNDASADEKPQHRVRITRPFYLGATEVTQGQYRAVTGANPSNFKGSDDLPVEQVSWEEAQAFCAKLNELERGELSGARYRLPTEAEWEYACRAGTTTRFSFGDADASLGEYAWFTGNSDSKTHPVGQKRPNAWGLFDMHGNVWEWCGDGYDEKYYANSPGVDPSGPSQAADRVRVNRGGSWYDYPPYARSANRDWSAPGNRHVNLGFRVARVWSGP